ncbi:hypothetical protein TELCIR_07749 [Teladorsagia circumcincta]|uniref:Uncharacterized protein n=1 Tax=Teladorsagia circumcincta TaxID=45464 RepID=A0A2G9UJI6_TELCI|nr:hypothetical protein TELCIR_07749 [Teladorsagia circumcincta]
MKRSEADCVGAPIGALSKINNNPNKTMYRLLPILLVAICITAVCAQMMGPMMGPMGLGPMGMMRPMGPPMMGMMGHGMAAASSGL